MPTPEPPRSASGRHDRVSRRLPGYGTVQEDDDFRNLGVRGAPSGAPAATAVFQGRGTPAPTEPASLLRGQEDLHQRLRQNEREVTELRKTVTILTEKVTTLTATVDRLQSVAAAPQHTGDQEALQGLRQTETELRELQESMRSLTESVRLLTSPEIDAETSAQALDRAQVVITYSRSYWIRIDGSLGLDEGLAVAEHQLMDMRTRRDVPPNDTSAVVSAVAKIGAATIVGACVGAPIGAYVVGDAIVKEMVKAALAGLVVQTAMELTEFGIDRARCEPP